MKKVKIYYVIFIFLLSFLWHFMYKWFPNNVFAIFFPVNESIWEHMKIIYGCFIFGAFFENYLLKKLNVSYNNFYIEIFAKSILGILFYLITYVPLHKIFGENIIIAISVLLLTFIVMEIIGSKILKAEETNIKYMPICIMVLGYILFAILTFYPPNNHLFFDENKMVYGIPYKK